MFSTQDMVSVSSTHLWRRRRAFVLVGFKQNCRNMDGQRRLVALYYREAFLVQNYIENLG